MSKYTGVLTHKPTYTLAVTGKRTHTHTRTHAHTPAMWGFSYTFPYTLGEAYKPARHISYADLNIYIVFNNDLAPCAKIPIAPAKNCRFLPFTKYLF